MSDGSTNQSARWLLVIIIALMLLGSLQPFHLRHVVFDSPLELVLHLRWRATTASDLIVNVLLYAPFGAALAWVLPDRWSAPGRVAAATLAGCALSLGVEIAQWFIVTRVASLSDVAMNTVGALAGCAAGLGVRALAERLARSDLFGFTSEPVGAALLLAWLASFLPDWLPRFAPRHWPQEWQLHLATGWPGWQPVAMQALGWLIAGVLLRALTRPPLVWPALATLAVAVLGVRFTWFGHFAGNAEPIGAALALLFWPLAARLPERLLLGILAAALLGGIAYRGLAPFEFGALRHDLHWLPFTDLVGRGSTGFNLPLLAGKAYSYGALVWLLVAAGGPPIRTGLATAGLLLIIEIAQLCMPEGAHYSTLTDPAIALGAGAILGLVGRAGRGAGGASRRRPPR